MNAPTDVEQRQRLNLETGEIHWQELQRYFAKGIVIKVTKELDLVEVALKFTQDDKETIETWQNNGLLSRPTDDDAKQWEKNQTTFWAVVVAPWVIVQEITKQ